MDHISDRDRHKCLTVFIFERIYESISGGLQVKLEAQTELLSERGKTPCAPETKL